MSATGTWWAWRPVRLGALGTGPWAWGRRVWFNTTFGVSIYQEMSDVTQNPFNAADEIQKCLRERDELLEKHRRQPAPPSA